LFLLQIYLEKLISIFEIYLDQDRIRTRIEELGIEISKDYKGKNPLFISVLNGSFVFAADLLRKIDIESEISFVKLSSYKGVQSTGVILEKIGLQQDLEGRHVIILDDIVDTGLTAKFLKDMLSENNSKSVEIASLLVKTEIFKNRYQIRYIGFQVENKFLVGYGMDYDEQGRNLPSIYKEKQ